jgi:hypothetical protein
MGGGFQLLSKEIQLVRLAFPGFKSLVQQIDVPDSVEEILMDSFGQIEVVTAPCQFLYFILSYNMRELQVQVEHMLEPTLQPIQLLTLAAGQVACLLLLLHPVLIIAELVLK